MKVKKNKSLSLLEQLRRAVRVRHYSIRTERSYVDWVKDFVVYHNMRHPGDMTGEDINQYLSHLASDRNVASSTQRQALSAIMFLYKHVLNRDPGELGDIVKAKRPQKLPVVLSADETERIISQLQGTTRLMVMLLYGAGMRLMEVIRLRVKDVDFENGFIVVRDGKGKKDRTVPLPGNIAKALTEHIERVDKLHKQDLAQGYGTVHLPYALARKYPNADRELKWQYVFPSRSLSVDPRTGRKQRHHVFENALQKAIKTATVRAGIEKPVHAHTFRHSFATHLLLSGTDIRTIQQLLGHKDLNTTMIYTHVVKKGPLGVTSPADRLHLSSRQRLRVFSSPVAGIAALCAFMCRIWRQHP